MIAARGARCAMTNATYEQLQAELRYVTWQRDRLAEALNAMSGKWKLSPNDDYRSKGEAIADLIMMVMGDGDD